MHTGHECDNISLSKISGLNKTDNIAIIDKCTNEIWFVVYNESCQLTVTCHLKYINNPTFTVHICSTCQFVPGEMGEEGERVDKN